MKKKSVMGMILVLGLSTVLTACGGKTGTDEKKDSAVMVDVMTAQKDTLTLSNQFMGTVMPQDSVYIIPLAQGKITRTYFEVGDTVRAGDVMLEIDDEAAQMQLKQAELTYKNTKLQLDSTWDSANDQQTSAIDQLEAQRTAALAQLQAAQTQYYTLKDSVEQGEEALELMQKQVKELDTMSTDEVLKLAADMLKSMASSSTGGVNIDSILGDKIDIEDIIGGNIEEADKDKLAEELRPVLKDMLEEQIASAKSSMKQAQMSLNAAETSMNAAQESFELLEQSIYDTVHTDLGETKQQLDTNLELAKLAVESAELALSYYHVTTPISGTVIAKSAEVNGFATSSQAAYVIANDDVMTVTFSVSESVKNTLTVGNGFTVERSGSEYTGAITEIGNAVNQQTGLFQVKGVVYANGTELPSGVSVKVTVDTYKAEQAVIIPYDAVYYENESAYVYVMADGIAVKTPVTTGIFDTDSIEIVDGVKAGETVIVSWSPRLINGAEVAATAVENAN